MGARRRDVLARACDLGVRDAAHQHRARRRRGCARRPAVPAARVAARGRHRPRRVAARTRRSAPRSAASSRACCDTRRRALRARATPASPQLPLDLPARHPRGARCSTPRSAARSRGAGSIPCAARRGAVRRARRRLLARDSLRARRWRPRDGAAARRRRASWSRRSARSVQRPVAPNGCESRVTGTATGDRVVDGAGALRRWSSGCSAMAAIARYCEWHLFVECGRSSASAAR